MNNREVETPVGLIGAQMLRSFPQRSAITDSTLMMSTAVVYLVLWLILTASGGNGADAVSMATGRLFSANNNLNFSLLFTWSIQ